MTSFEGKEGGGEVDRGGEGGASPVDDILNGGNPPTRELSWRPVGRPQAFRELCRGFGLTQRRFPPPLGQRVFSRRRRHAESRTRPLPRTFARLPEHSCVPNYFQAARRFEPGRHGPLAVSQINGAERPPLSDNQCDEQYRPNYRSITVLRTILTRQDLVTLVNQLEELVLYRLAELKTIRSRRPPLGVERRDRKAARSMGRGDR